MSKLDYITIGIVAICILAIVFLVYKMTDLFGGKTPTDNIEAIGGPVETEDDVYNPDEDLATNNGLNDNTGTTATDNEPRTTPATNPADDDRLLVDDDDDDRAADNDPEPVRRSPESYSSGGKFMVFAGTFSKKYLAEDQARKLRSEGYENAKVEMFDRGKYAVVLVDRFDNMAAAERLVANLKSDGINSYVKTKERR